MSIELRLEENTAAVKELTEVILLGYSQQSKAKEPVEDVKIEEEPKKAKPAKPTKEAIKEEPKPEKATKPSSSTLTIDEVRAQLMPLVGDHNPLIAETIKQLGGSTLSSLDASKYQELLDTVNAKIAG
jgi:hypothetical protein